MPLLAIVIFTAEQIRFLVERERQRLEMLTSGAPGLVVEVTASRLPDGSEIAVIANHCVLRLETPADRPPFSDSARHEVTLWCMS